jgi:ribA/ribD-fused uncharacterized protein
MNIENFNIDVLGTAGDYAGIGSRKINKKDAYFQILTGFCMALSGYRVNTGAADGSDTNFEYGAKLACDLLKKNTRFAKQLDDYSKVVQVFLPWDRFNGRETAPGYIAVENPDAELITAKYHKNWEYLKDPVRKMMSRNAMQVLGIDLFHKVKCVICETPDGAYTGEMTTDKTGGTGQAIRIADDKGVKVFNIKNPEHKQRLIRWTDSFSSDCIDLYGFNPKDVVKDSINQHVGIKNHQEGDLIKIFKEGDAEVLIHGCSVQNTKGSGFAKMVFENFPEAYHADQKTKKGDKRKLGTYSVAEVDVNGKKKYIVNAYTQQYWGRDPEELYVDYNKVREAFKKIAKDFRGKKVAFPMIGAGLANGCWITLSNVIEDALRFMPSPLLVTLPGKGLSINNDLANFKIPMTNDDKFVFFWGKTDPFSQWHYSEFTENDITFDNCEQYMMYHKAILFNDHEKAKEILINSDPATCKEKGRQVANFNQEIWDKNCEKIIIEGNKLKFSQNPNLLKSLVCSGNRVLVEASPYDKIYGIGMKESHKDARNPLKWNGKNLLGKSLEKSRTSIMLNEELLSTEAKSIVQEYKALSNQEIEEDSAEEYDQMSLI